MVGWAVPAVASHRQGIGRRGEPPASGEHV